MLARALERDGVVAIDLSGGSNESPELSRFCIQPPSFPRRCLEPYARPLKRALGIPVIVAGRIITPEDAEAVLQAGSADFISLGRALIADPHWCAKAFGDVAAPVRLVHLVQHLPRAPVSRTRCLVRAESARRHGVRNAGVSRAARQSRDAAGGCAPEECSSSAPASAASRPRASPRDSVTTSRSGRRPTWPAGRCRWRSPHRTRWMWLACGPTESPSSISLACRSASDRSITAERIRELRTGHGICRDGRAGRAISRWLSICRCPVRQAWDVLLDPQSIEPGATVTIVGGGIVGIETADLLVTRGCRVTVIEIQATVAPEMARNNRFEVLARLERAGARILTERADRGGRRWATRGRGDDGERSRLDPGRCDCPGARRRRRIATCCRLSRPPARPTCWSATAISRAIF